MHIKELIDATDLDWGNPADNRAHLLPFGLPPLDNALYGINIVDGELIAIQGQEKSRKTTLLANIVVNIMLSGILPKLGKSVCIDTLESGETIERCRDRLIAMMAAYSLLAVRHGNDRSRWQPAVILNEEQLKFSPEFLRFADRTPAQHKAIQFVKEIIRDWPLHIFGGSRFKERATATRNLKKSMERWKKLAEEGVVIFATDHIQEYDLPGTDDYHRQDIIVPALSNHQMETATAVIALSQISLSSIKDYQAGILNVMYAKGGGRLAAEANVVIQTIYDEANAKVTIDVPRSRKARAKVYQYLDPVSGLFIGPPIKTTKGSADGREV